MNLLSGLSRPFFQRLIFRGILLLAAAGVNLQAWAAGAINSESADAHIVSVVPITEVFADGWKVSAVAVQYDRKIRDASLTPAAYRVETGVDEQKILRVYTSDDGEKTTRRNLNGAYVILELSTDYRIPVRQLIAPAPPAAPAARPANQAPRAQLVKQELTLNAEVVTSVGEISWEPGFHPATLKSSKHGGSGKSVVVHQLGSITAVDGSVLTSTTADKDNFYCRNLIVDGFLKADYTGGPNGNAKYNIHFPRHYDPAKQYPVVLFLADMSAVTRYVHAETLIQGQGGVIWASPEDEARHEAIVVTPITHGAMLNDKFEIAHDGPEGKKSTPLLAILSLMDYLQAKIPNIDKSRLYITGQGDGARAAIRMMLERPGYFAAALLFAPDYDPAQLAPLAKSKLWIVASEGDAPVLASMDAGVAALKQAGARADKVLWDGQAAAAQLAANVKKQASDGSNLHYTLLKKGTAVPAGVEDNTLNNHAYTWRTGYGIAALRDWLLEQK